MEKNSWGERERRQRGKAGIASRRLGIAVNVQAAGRVCTAPAMRGSRTHGGWALGKDMQGPGLGHGRLDQQSRVENRRFRKE